MSLYYNFTERKDSNTGEFCEIFFTEQLQVTTSVLRKKYFINKIVKNPLREGEKIERACKKNNHADKTKT